MRSRRHGMRHKPRLPPDFTPSKRHRSPEIDSHDKENCDPKPAFHLRHASEALKTPPKPQFSYRNTSIEEEESEKPKRNTDESDREMPGLSILPSRVFCPNCLTTVSTTVELHLPSLSWQVFCLLSNCSSCLPQAEDDFLGYQEIRHHCRRCKRLLTRISPV